MRIYDGQKSKRCKRLEGILESLDLLTEKDEPASAFSKVTQWLKKVLSPEKIGIDLRFDESGMPVATPFASYADSEASVREKKDEVIQHEDALGLLDELVENLGVTVWVCLDRLDEAFLGYPEVETPALRALLRTYLDLLEFPRIRLKIFLRRDLFSKIMVGGFVNLTHVNARKAEIIWDDDDLFALLCRRIRENQTIMEHLKKQSENLEAEDLFYAVLPRHVRANKQQTTWQWMLTKTRDGKGCIQPRNLIDLITFAKDEQVRREHFSPYHRQLPLVSPAATLRAFERLSEQRVQDTIIAEASKEVAVCIQALRDGKAEHNESSLSKALGLKPKDARPIIEVMMELGLLEPKGATYRVPILYRKGLNIKLGKAFSVPNKKPRKVF